jgi:hypothetical protein
LYLRYTLDRVIPWSGCAPAEPASVSPGSRSIAPIMDNARRLKDPMSKIPAPALKYERQLQRGNPGKEKWSLRFVLG